MKYGWYYLLRPLIPRWLQIAARRMQARARRKSASGSWPICATTLRGMRRFPSWPEGKQFAFLLRHDVESAHGLSRCLELAKIDEELGFRSSFNLVPQRYNTPGQLRKALVERGFEIGVHGLRHDGREYASHRVFERRAVQINRFLREWGAVGYYSPSAHHQLDWFHRLEIEYDSSTFDTDPFEPQPNGVGSIHPFWVAGGESGYVELPYTLAQDFTLFVLLGERTIRVWRDKLDWIAARGGMALVNAHPDYMRFEGERKAAFRYPVQLYRELLGYVREHYAGRYWHVLPSQLARYWRNECQGLKAQVAYG